MHMLYELIAFAAIGVVASASTMQPCNSNLLKLGAPPAFGPYCRVQDPVVCLAENATASSPTLNLTCTSAATNTSGCNLLRPGLSDIYDPFRVEQKCEDANDTPPPTPPGCTVPPTHPPTLSMVPTRVCVCVYARKERGEHLTPTLTLTLTLIILCPSKH